MIGNPPYVTFKGKEKVELNDSDLKKLIQFHPNSAEYKINSYALFIETGIKLLIKGGNINYIIPSTILQNEYLKNIRRYLITKNSLINITTFGNKVFDAVTDSIILIAKKEENLSSNCVSIRKNDLNFSSNKMKYYQTSIWNNKPDFIINLKTDPKEDIVLNKITNNCDFIENYLNVYVGIVAKGIKQYLSHEALDINHKKYLQGKHIGNYELKPQELFINFIKEKLHSNTDEQVYNQKEKILVRKTGNKLIAVIDNQQYFTDQSIYNLYPKKGQVVDLTFITVLLNSKLLDYYFNKKMITNEDVFPYIKGIHLKKLPIKFPKSQEGFINIANEIIKQKKLGLKTISLENEINIMVYKLYELTFEDVKIIEPNFSLSKKEYNEFTFQ